MSGRLPTGLLVGALLRRVNDAGGMGMVRARGNPQAGAVLVVLEAPGMAPRLVERGIGPDGKTALVDSTPADDLDGYWRRRRQRDPDLWVVELTIADGERFTAETILDG